MKSSRNFLVKSTSECYFWLANIVSTDSNEYFLKFSWKVFRISFMPKSHFQATFDSNFKILKVFEIFWSKVHQNAISDLQTKFQLILTSIFLKFSWKVFRIIFRPKKVTFRPLLIQTLKYWKVFEIFWSKVHQNAISDKQTKFQLILLSTFWNFHEKCLESVLGRKSHF